MARNDYIGVADYSNPDVSILNPTGRKKPAVPGIGAPSPVLRTARNAGEYVARAAAMPIYAAKDVANKTVNGIAGIGNSILGATTGYKVPAGGLDTGSTGRNLREMQAITGDIASDIGMEPVNAAPALVRTAAAATPDKTIDLKPDAAGTFAAKAAPVGDDPAYYNQGRGGSAADVMARDVATVPPIGSMSIDGVPGATASIGKDGTIQRSAAWEKTRSDAIAKNGGIGGSVNYVPSIDERAASDFNPDGTPRYERRPEMVGIGGQLKTNVPLAEARAKGMLSPEQQTYYDTRDLARQKVSQEGEYQRGTLAIDKPYKEGLVANQRFAAEEGARARIESAEALAAGKVEAAKAKTADDGAKDHKGLVQTYYNTIKGLNLPKGFEGRHMELAKDLADAQDPTTDTGIYYAPGSDKQGIYAKKSVYEPLLNDYLAKGHPAADAHGYALRDLQALERQQGVKLSKPFPNLDRLVKNDHKPVDDLGVQ